MPLDRLLRMLGRFELHAIGALTVQIEGESIAKEGS